MGEIPLLGQKKPEEPKAPEVPEIVPAVTAFIVYMTEDGRVLVDANLDSPIAAQRPPTFDDIYGMCSNTLKDVQNTDAAIKSANAVLNGMMQINKQMAEAQQSAQIQEALVAAQRQQGKR